MEHLEDKPMNIPEEKLKELQDREDRILGEREKRREDKEKHLESIYQRLFK